jgi:Skp family chaperone for outer membrane proteins
VKWKLIILAGVAVLGIAAYVGTQLWAQTPGAGAAPNCPKIGLMNLAYVLKGYNKFKVYNDEIEKIRVQYEKQEMDLKKSIADWKTYWERKDISQPDKDKAEDAVKTLQRRVEDNINEYKKVRGKKSDEQMVQMYKEVEDTVKSWAGSNGFHMILHYSEALADSDKYVPQNVQRKLVGPGQSGGVCPIYFTPGMDVSEDIVRALNTRYPAPAVTSTPAAGAQPH